eukprot:Plantae.Rhodophyta-Purpureofilum_apyrenoidigerum.ctg6957.p1 GENE.Plantae.Rhodophyta-Purpureofilum_apyrenoidigerum.ctg6957~~Plantae.Rhodophyta-Purpureofilum_apyrenoidigerum.ctg6957.p1  ORF type:complete len:348 (+),score=49.91 Plantae.Rhodophyta-Purpureofilum_apyrenoidigerum.ctg6957:636-1679(+)
MVIVQIAVPTDEVVNASSLSVSRLGGTPVWPETLSGAINPKCERCNEVLPLLCQVHAPVPAANERVIYVFVCSKAECSISTDGWAVLRVRKPDAGSRTSAEDYGQREPEGQEAAERDSDNAEPWSASQWNDGDDIQFQELEELLRLQKLRLSDPQSGNDSEEPARASYCTTLPRFCELEVNVPSRRYVPLEWRDEPQKQELSSGEQQRIVELIQRYEKDEEHQEGAEATDQFQEEEYEKDNLSEQNRPFQKMVKRINREPRQCIRYCYGDTVLYVNEADENFSIRKCESCGSERTAEMQLLSTIIYLTGEEVLVGGMDWGTAVIYTCAADCDIENEFCREQAYVESF